jgi:2-polyprenyl-3-methyl-5-hydroxy-6-metoxy-1,4-benzoquinol methylase
VPNVIEEVTKKLTEHYARKFREFGPTPAGVDWGKEADVRLRYDKMLAVTDHAQYSGSAPVLLDVGCGYGGLLLRARERGLTLNYTGVDSCQEMIHYAREHNGEGTYICSDIFDFSPADQYDFVVCNGILTQKLTTSIQEMNVFAQALIKKAFSLCRGGIVFNVMSSHVNFIAANLYYRDPSEFLAWCMAEVSSRATLDHSYPLYDYTMYLYHH